MTLTEKREQGAALITVLFIMMIASLIIMAMLSRQRLDVDRTTTMIAQSQGYAYAIGAEELAQQVLVENAQNSPGLDFLGQRWAKLNEGVPVTDGTLTLHLEDVQGRFNVNTLIDTDAARTRFATLTHSLHLRDEVATLIIAALGSTISPKPFANITQLYAVPGVTPEEIRTLLPYVWALPERESDLNVNTAPELVLRAYIANDAAYTNLAKILTGKGFITKSQLNAIGTNTKGMSAESHNFLLHTQARVSGRNLSMTSIIARDSDILGNIHIRVISRDLGGPL